MNDLPRQKLAEIIAQFGRGLCDDPRRCEGLLKDFCGEHKREIFVLVSAIKERVPADLMSASESVPKPVLIARLMQRLCDNLALSEDAARWAVESWALALGIVSLTDVVSSEADTAPAVEDLSEDEIPENRLRDAIYEALQVDVLTDEIVVELTKLRCQLDIPVDVAERMWRIEVWRKANGGRWKPGIPWRDCQYSLEPKILSEFIGQKRLKAALRINMNAARARNEALDHMLLYGLHGLGKTTLSNIVANEMEVPIRITSGPAIEKPGDLAAILTSLEKNSVFFIDEIHRLNRTVEEILYPAMEDYKLDIIIGRGPSARTLRLDLPRFTLVGATTEPKKLSSPLRNSFAHEYRLEPYSLKELGTFIYHYADSLGIRVSADGVKEIAQRSQSTPKIALRILKCVRDYAQVRAHGIITRDVTLAALQMVDTITFLIRRASDHRFDADFYASNVTIKESHSE